MLASEAHVLAALAEHGPMTARALQVAGVSEYAARTAPDSLAYSGLLTRTSPTGPAEWTLTARGRAYTATTRGRAVLDVPTNGGR